MKIQKERRSVSYTILLGVWAIVAVYAVLHDQYIVRIAPEHFTVYHDSVFGIESPEVTAAILALGASVSPGLTLGMACVFVARWGRRPKVKRHSIFGGVLFVVIMTETLCASVGFYVYRSRIPVFPEFLYPDHSLPMLVTQSIQLSCYFGGAIFSGLFLMAMLVYRKRMGSAHLG
ncbi:MAG: hypothetical protein P1U89_25655 [Verrucomicrobiales bacterium]|nr:hypothetical protein [Verrucomicrobiales bacterium]